ncbi:MAG: hypothetical protein ACRERV_16385 [Methylococcales bacterium]
MVGTIGVVCAIATLIWFYYTAEKVGKNQALWAVIGALSYFMTRLLWTYVVFRPIIGPGVYDHSENVRFWGGASAIVVAIVVVVLINKKLLRKAGE